MYDPTDPPDVIVEISPKLAKRIQEELGQNVYLCFQCVKCSSGCPVANFFDWQPNQIIRAVQLGQEDIALNANTPWLCASCQTCTSRCPQGLDIAGIMEFLTREALQRGNKPRVSQVDHFNRAFLHQVKIWGRAYEPGMMVEMKLRKPDSLFDDTALYVKMLRKRKVSVVPEFTRVPHEVKEIPGAANSVAYYPGCSLHSTAPEYDHSAKQVCEALGIRLIEPRGWICCGSSAAHRYDPEVALRLPMENLRLMEQSGFQEVTMPCAACFNRHKSALYEIRHHPESKSNLDAQTGYVYEDRVEVNSLYQTIIKRISLDGLSHKVQKPLMNLRLVCYYGCLLTRPPEITEATQPENPLEMDLIMKTIGAEVLDWSYKTTCCGASHSLTRPDIVIELSGRLTQYAEQSGADAIVVACPLCHANLDARQFQMDLPAPMPVLYFTQLMAIALGLPEIAAKLDKNMIDPRPLLNHKGLL